MAEFRQKIRGTTLQLDQQIALEGLLAYDTEKNQLRVYDGVTMGGYKILNEAQIAALYTLPDRLDPDGVDLNGLSANAALTNGWYRCTATTTDTPEVAAAALRVEVTTNGTVITQNWTRGSTGAKYRRQRDAALVWSPWVRIVDLTYLTTDPAAKAYDADRLDGQDSTYYTAIAARLGYTPANKAGDTFTGGITGTTLTMTGNVSVGGTLGVTGVATLTSTLSVNGGQITISGAAPSIYLRDTDAGKDDFWVWADGDSLFVLTDRADDGSFEVPHPLELRNGDSSMYVYGFKAMTTANGGAGSNFNADMVDGVHLAGLMQTSWTLTAGVGLTGGGDGSASRSVAMGTPSSITSSSTNSATGTTHSHSLGFVAAQVYSAAVADETNLPIGHVLTVYCSTADIVKNQTVGIGISVPNSKGYVLMAEVPSATQLAGTWRARGQSLNFLVAQRVS